MSFFASKLNAFKQNTYYRTFSRTNTVVVDKDEKIRLASRTVYEQQKTPDVISLAKSLINIDEANLSKIQGRRKDFKQERQASIENFIHGVCNYIPEENRIKSVKNSWRQAGKNSYIKGRCLTASLDSSASIASLMFQALRLAGHVGVEAAMTFTGCISTLLILGRLGGDFFTGLRRSNVKASEETYASFGFPKLSDDLLYGSSIEKSLEDTECIDFTHIINQLENLIDELQNSPELLMQEDSESLIHSSLEAQKKLKNLNNAYGRHSLENCGYKLNLIINISHDVFQLALSIISDLSLLFAPAAPVIKTALAAVSALSVVSQYTCNHLFSGEGLKNKFMQTIFVNLNSANFIKPKYSIVDIKDDIDKLDKGIISKEAVTNLLRNKIEVNNLTSTFRKPYQHKIDISKQWLDMEIYKQLDRLITLRFKEESGTACYEQKIQIKHIEKRLRDLYEDKLIVDGLGKLNTEIEIDAIEEIFTSLKTEETLNIFYDNNFAREKMVEAKKGLVNERYRYIGSYFAPGVLASMFSAPLNGIFLGCDITLLGGNSHLSNYQDLPPVSSLISGINSATIFANPANNAYSEIVKAQTADKSKKKNTDFFVDENNNFLDINYNEKNIFNGLITLIMTDKNKLNQVDNMIFDILHNENKYCINIERNKVFAKKFNLISKKQKIKTFRKSFLSSFTAPYLYLIKGRNRINKNRENFYKLNKLLHELEKIKNNQPSI